MLTTKALRLEGFTIVNYMQHAAAFATEVGPLVASGELEWDETIVDGIDNALDAFYGLLRGANTGKMLVRTTPSD
jgi:hypothetical protein